MRSNECLHTYKSKHVLFCTLCVSMFVLRACELSTCEHTHTHAYMFAGESVMGKLIFN